MSHIQKRLEELNITLPNAAAPAANYVPYVKSGNMITISGQLPFIDGDEFACVGKVGEQIDVDHASDIARRCGINIIAQVSAAVKGKLDQVRCVRLGVFINATDDFTKHPVVANGVSDLMVDVFGDRGKHARFAVGVSSLPMGVAVEVDAVFEVV